MCDFAVKITIQPDVKFCQNVRIISKTYTHSLNVHLEELLDIKYGT